MRVNFGLGDRSAADEVTVRWPGGKSETRRNIAADGIVTWVEGVEG